MEQTTIKNVQNEIHKFQNLIKKTPCYKNLENPTC